MVERCRATQPGIAQGVHGCVHSTSKVVFDLIEPLEGFRVDLYASDPGGADARPIASTTSNAIGHYEIASAQGRFWLCATVYRCSMIEVAAEQVIRRDYDYGLGPQWIEDKGAPPHRARMREDKNRSRV